MVAALLLQAEEAVEEAVVGDVIIGRAGVALPLLSPAVLVVEVGNLPAVLAQLRREALQVRAVLEQVLVKITAPHPHPRIIKTIAPPAVRMGRGKISLQDPPLLPGDPQCYHRIIDKKRKNRAENDKKKRIFIDEKNIKRSRKVTLIVNRSRIFMRRRAAQRKPQRTRSTSSTTAPRRRLRLVAEAAVSWVSVVERKTMHLGQALKRVVQWRAVLAC